MLLGPRIHSDPASGAAKANAHGFTLAEMVVAIGAVALLTVGIGQIFQSVGALVGTGAAVAETDQMARALEARLREDFASLNRMRAHDTFLIIRSRELEGVYLSAEDRDSDRREGIAPDDDDSLAFDTRLDEICFLGFGSGNSGLFKSAQLAEPRPGYTSPSAPTALLYYGHGLRPKPPLRFDPDQPGANSNVPERLFIPDGDFGQGVGERNRFDASRVSGRNEFASSWILLRQAVVLIGPQIAGPEQTNVGAGFDPILTYTPLIRVREVAVRDLEWPGINNKYPDSWPGNKPGLYEKRPKPRFLPFGRTDICAQTPEEVKRWLEGYPLQLSIGGSPISLVDATPFDSGIFDVRNLRENTGALTNIDDMTDAALWRRDAVLATAPDARKRIVNLTNLARYQSALAGILTRRQAESVPPLIDRYDTLIVGGGQAAGVTPRGDDPATALMDLHSTLGTRCSRFAISWSDGTTWPVNEPRFEEDSDDDGIDDIIFEPGDIVWFDLDFSKHDPNDNDSYEDVLTTVDPPVPPFHNPEITHEAIVRQGGLSRLVTTDVSGAYTIGADGEFPDSLYTGAAPRDTEEEYLGVWGYQLLDLNASGEFSDFAWPKPKLIRIRVTLHDQQLRLDSGRIYEFVFAINLAN